MGLNPPALRTSRFNYTGGDRATANGKCRVGINRLAVRFWLSRFEPLIPLPYATVRFYTRFLG